MWSYTTLQCPSQVTFSITLPSTFQDGDDSRALPPSYHYVKKEGPPSQEVLVKYQLHFVVACVRHQKLQDVWQKKQQYVYHLLTSVSLPYINFLLSIVVPFNYVPRTCPVRPIVATPCFFSSVKTSPEEWHQAMTCLELRRSDVEMGPIFCHVCLQGLRCLRTVTNYLLTALRSRWSNIRSYRHHQFSYTNYRAFMFSI